ncbi:AraC-like ligand-binding domain-containing protein [Streptomyces spongiae]|uniref:Helix-turn-helix domain-containing protein n=1 Tax=Streptomyces spongiae TaxID=565072 RepID=A0A5N8XRY6_9ACTN|nr:helix-turn-helix domain-containing protein [Streptomyces spongiae]
MVAEVVFRSEDVPAADRFDWWRERMNQTHAPMELTSEFAADFRAHQRIIGLGDVSVWPAVFQPLVNTRTAKHIKQSDPEVYHLSLLLGGTATMTWDDRQAVYGPSDFLINDSSRPVEIRAGQESIRTIGVEIPKARLSLSPAKVDQIVGRRLAPLSGQEGIGALLAQFLTRLSADTGSYQVADGPRLATVVVDLASALFAHVLDAEEALCPEARRRALVLRIQAFIRQNLHDPGLTPRTVAAAHHISPSYLHRVFRDENDTVTAYLRRERLERTRRDLADPALRAVPVHRIAARWGFSHPAAFSRAFRTAYGYPPSHHRELVSSPSG